MNISGLHSVQTAQPLSNVQRAAQTTTDTPSSDAASRIALKDDIRLSSAVAQLEGESGAISDSPSQGVRFELVNRIRAQIAEGTYDTPDKMDLAIDRMLSRLNPK